MDIFYPKRGQKEAFFDHLPPHLVHVVFERPPIATTAPPVYGRSFNPISTRGADYAYHRIQAPRIFRPCDGPEVCTTYALYNNPESINHLKNEFLMGQTVG